MEDPTIILHRKVDKNLNNEIRRGNTVSELKRDQPTQLKKDIYGDDPSAPDKVTVELSQKFIEGRKALGLSRKDLAQSLSIRESDVQFFETPGGYITDKKIFGKLKGKLCVKN